MNVTGYGKLIGASVEGAYRFYQFLDGKKFTVRGRTIVCHCLTKPNFNMVDYIFNEEGNTNLVAMNKLNHDFYDWASYAKGGLYENEFITSHTDFATSDYGDSPFDFVNRLGFNWEGWQHTQKVTILRASCMSPYMYDKDCFGEYAGKIESAIQKKLEAIYDEYDLNA